MTVSCQRNPFQPLSMSTATGRVKHISLLCTSWKYPLQKRLKHLMRSLARGYGGFPRSQKLAEMLL